MIRVPTLYLTVVSHMTSSHKYFVEEGEEEGEFPGCKLTLFSLQILEEPGEDNTKFDYIVPTIVKPKTAEEFIIESALKGHVSSVLLAIQSPTVSFLEAAQSFS